MCLDNHPAFRYNGIAVADLNRSAERFMQVFLDGGRVVGDMRHGRPASDENGRVFQYVGRQ